MEVVRFRDPAEYAAAARPLLMRREAEIADVYTRAGVGPGSVVRRAQDRLDEAAAARDSKARQLEAARTSSRELRRQETGVASDLNRARKPLTFEQKVAVADAKEADAVSSELSK